MGQIKSYGLNDMELIEQFAKQEGLRVQQQEQFKNYLDLLIAWNANMNLTALDDPEKIITYHFKDSLEIDRFVPFNTVQTIADVGTGPGFPAIPLKIKYPHLSVILIEVTEKKIRFLKEIINRLQLSNIEICDLDWRTFLRKTNYPIDFFVTRAALAPSELIRMFSPTCLYNTSTLIYWASAQWQSTQKEKTFIDKELNYQIGNKMRKFIFFSVDQNSKN